MTAPKHQSLVAQTLRMLDEDTFEESIVLKALMRGNKRNRAPALRALQDLKQLGLVQAQKDTRGRSWLYRTDKPPPFLSSPRYAPHPPKSD